MNLTPIPASSPPACATSGGTVRVTSPSSKRGSDSAGSVKENWQRVPRANGRGVLMKVPPLEMFFV